MFKKVAIMLLQGVINVLQADVGVLPNHVFWIKYLGVVQFTIWLSCQLFMPEGKYISHIT